VVYIPHPALNGLRDLTLKADIRKSYIYITTFFVFVVGHYKDGELDGFVKEYGLFIFFLPTYWFTL